jgi:hypothetical protein
MDNRELVERLRTEAEPWSAAIHTGSGPRLGALLREAAAALESAEKDAARYRWLRARPYVDIAACWLVADDVDTPEKLDAAIDAALSAKGSS